MSTRDDDPQLQALLAGLREDPADDGFGARLHLRLAAAGVPPEPSARARAFAWLRERPWLVGAVSGAASGLAAFALASALAGGAERAGSAPRAALAPASAPAPVVCAEPAAATAATAPSASTSAEVFVVPVGKVAMVQLHFAVDRDVDEAEFSVVLPDGLAFFSEGAALPERAFHWSAPLARGDNRVPVAVIGAQPGRHRLAATATIAGEVVVHEIVLDVQGPA
jgi:hypothetical protein